MKKNRCEWIFWNIFSKFVVLFGFMNYSGKRKHALTFYSILRFKLYFWRLLVVNYNSPANGYSFWPIIIVLRIYGLIRNSIPWTLYIIMILFCNVMSGFLNPYRVTAFKQIHAMYRDNQKKSDKIKSILILYKRFSYKEIVEILLSPV